MTKFNRIVQPRFAKMNQARMASIYDSSTFTANLILVLTIPSSLAVKLDFLRLHPALLASAHLLVAGSWT